MDSVWLIIKTLCRTKCNAHFYNGSIIIQAQDRSYKPTWKKNYKKKTHEVMFNARTHIKWKAINSFMVQIKWQKYKNLIVNSHTQKICIFLLFCGWFMVAESVYVDVDLWAVIFLFNLRYLSHSDDCCIMKSKKNAMQNNNWRFLIQNEK